MATIKQKHTSFKKDHFEEVAWSQNNVIMGIDEVGCGCLAGPVVIGAAILSLGKKSRLLKDSKLLEPEERLKAYNWLVKHSTFATAVIDHRLIDKHNIYQARLLGMQRAVAQLLAHSGLKPTIILVDAMPLQIPYFEGDIYHFIKGESKSSSIAAASIVAKVTRDALIQKLAISIPGYNLESHKGYSVPVHKQKLREFGASIIHRTTFIDHLFKNNFSDENLTLFDTINPEIEL